MNELVEQKSIDWRAIFDIFEDDEQAVVKSQAAVLLGCGATRPSVSEQLGVKEQTIKSWMLEDPNFRRAIDSVKSDALAYIQSKVPLRIAQADKHIDWILSQDPTSNALPKELRTTVLREQGLTSRELFRVMIDKYRQQKPSVHITEAVFNISDNAAEILAGRIKDVTPDET